MKNQKDIDFKIVLNRIASFLGVDICYLLGCKGALNDDF
jgi:hypothetical protein